MDDQNGSHTASIKGINMNVIYNFTSRTSWLHVSLSRTVEVHYNRLILKFAYILSGHKKRQIVN